MPKHDIKDSSDPTPETTEVQPKSTAPVESTPERPDWLPEKFKSPEDFAKSYSELESKLGKETSTEPEVKPKPGEKPEIPKPAEPEAEDFFSTFETEYSEKGALSEESYEQLLEKKGLRKDQVDAYIRGREAQAQAEVTAVHEAVGGGEAWDAMTKWAAESLPAERVDALNGMLSQGGESAVLAAQALKSAYGEKNDIQGDVLEADGISITDGSTFESSAQVRVAMSDPRYKTDEAYRNKTIAKLLRSKV